MARASRLHYRASIANRRMGRMGPIKAVRVTGVDRRDRWESLWLSNPLPGQNWADSITECAVCGPGLLKKVEKLDISP